MELGPAALTVAALCAGAAFYVSVAEHPARLGLDPAAQLRQWKPAYKRGAMRASLALVGFVLGMASHAGDETVELLRRWGMLDGGGSALGLAAVAIFLYASGS